MRNKIVWSLGGLIILAVAAWATYAGMVLFENTQASTVNSDENADIRKQYDEALNLMHKYSGSGDQQARAIEILTELTLRYPDSAYPYIGMADLLYLRSCVSGCSAEAPQILALLDEAKKRDPQIADIYTVQAKVHVAAGEVEMARKAADKAIQIAPDSREAMFVQARVAQKEQKFGDSERWYRKAIEAHSDPDRKSNMYDWMAQMFLEQEPKRIDSAREAYRQSVALSPGSPWKANNYAWFLNQYTTDYDEAVVYLEKALSIMDFEAARSNLAQSLYFKWAQAYLSGRPDGSLEKAVAIAERTKIPAKDVYVKAPLGANPELTLAFIRSGLVTDVGAAGKYGETALTSAACKGNLALTKELIAKGADVNQADGNGQTALAHFVSQNAAPAVDYLLAHGARADQPEGQGGSVLYLAMSRDTEDYTMTRLLLDRGNIPMQAKIDTLAGAISVGNQELASLLLKQYKLDPNSLATQGGHLLVIAALMHQPRMVRLLLEAGADPWVKEGDKDLLATLEQVPADHAPPQIAEIVQMIKGARQKKAS